MSLLTVILIIFFSTLIYSKHHTSRNGSIHEQVHLSLTKDARSMMVTWITFEQIQAGFPLVKYGKNKSNFDEVQTGYTTKFVDKIGTITRFVHRVNLTELAFGTRYYYKVGFNESWSETTYSFATFPEGSDFGVKLCVYGDLGYNEKVTMDALIRDVRNGRCQLIVHLGDIAYSLHYDDGKIGDEFMRAMEPAISSVPFMTSPGNHEFSCFGFDHYDNRFTMPVKDKISDVDSYYSFTLGPINFFAISSEVYGHVAVYGNDPIRRQAWQLEDDLKQAEARKSDKPWKIGYQHRPLYCFQEYYDQECNDYENKIMRSGYEDIPGLEILYQKYELNLLLMGHEHVYERLWPIYNRTIYKYPENKYFKNSPAPVHILTGAGGCDCTHQTSIELGPFSVKRDLQKSYTVIDVKNKTHMYIEQTNVMNNSTIDSFWMIKDLNYDMNTNGTSLKSEFVMAKNLSEYPYLTSIGPYQDFCLKKGMQLYNRSHNIQISLAYQNLSAKKKVIFGVHIAMLSLLKLINL